MKQVLSSHNPLVLILALVTAAGVAGAVYLYAVATGRETADVRKSFGALFFALGVFSLGGFVQLIWSDWAGFPAGHYSELFGTSTGLFSLMLIMAGFYLYTGLDLRMLAWPAAAMGLFLLQGARAVVDFGLTRNPPVTFALWLSAGLASVGMLPYAYSQGGARRTFAILGVIVLLVMALAALITGALAFYGHIAEVVRQQAR